MFLANVLLVDQTRVQRERADKYALQNKTCWEFVDGSPVLQFTIETGIEGRESSLEILLSKFEFVDFVVEAAECVHEFIDRNDSRLTVQFPVSALLDVGVLIELGVEFELLEFIVRQVPIHALLIPSGLDRDEESMLEEIPF